MSLIKRRKMKTPKLMMLMIEMMIMIMDRGCARGGGGVIQGEKMMFND